MGSSEFIVEWSGDSAKDAFNNAREDAFYNFGHAGYTGTIAEKTSFVKINCPKDKIPIDYAQELLDNLDKRIENKWGPAGCIESGPRCYIFFGFASD